MLALVLAFGVAQYYKIFDITFYTQPFFQGMYTTGYLVLLPFLAAVLVFYAAFVHFKSNLNLDTGLAKKSDEAKTEDLSWLNQFWHLGAFFKKRH